ncbi:MAG TPA: hypothetical protein PLD27_08855 [bacterium]|nr:hypothetical protein [bacterium]HPQ19270.1 hypothetical protein [bacterium]
MIKNNEILEQFEKEYLRDIKLDYKEKLKKFEELMNYAKKMNKWQPENYEESIKKDIEIARIINWRKQY